MICINGRSLNYPLSGIQRYLTQLIPKLPPTKILSPPTWLRGRGGHFWEQFILPKLVDRSVLWNPANTGPVILRVRRQVTTIHDLALLDPAINAATAGYYSWTMPRLAERSLGVLTPSEFSRRSIIDRFKYPPASIVAIPLGVDHTRFKLYKQIELEETLEKYSLTPGYLFTLGSVSPRKNLSRTLDAWSKAQQSLPKQTQFIVAGDIDSAERPSSMIPARTRFLGRVSEEDLPRLFAAAGAFIFASLHEGFGLPPLEAMACGTPCIVSNATSLPEVVGDAAALVDASDVVSLTNAVVDVLADRLYQEDLRSKGLARAAKFTWESAAESTNEFLSRFDHE